MKKIKMLKVIDCGGKRIKNDISLVRLVNHDESNVIKVAPVNFEKEPLEYLRVWIEPEAYVDVGHYLLKKNIIPYFSALKGSPFYQIESNELGKLFDNDNKLIENNERICIFSKETEGHSAALIKNDKILALSSSGDYDCFHTFDAIQPKVMNDAIVEYLKKEIVIPTQIGKTAFRYSLKGHSVGIERKFVTSIRDVNLGAELELDLGIYGIE